MLAQKKRWLRSQQLSDAEQAQLSQALAEFNLSPLLLQLLFVRGVIRPRPTSHHQPQTPEQMKAAVAEYLAPDKAPLPDPFLLTGVREAVERIEKAIKDGETIAVYGDFDCDGVTSATLLTQALKTFGAKVIIHVPHRAAEGYGLNIGALEKLSERGVKLVVTVDCGISDVKEVVQGQSLGMDMIVTDHHELSDDLPNCILINPKQEGDGAEKFTGLAGVGVAYQVVRGLVAKLGKPPALRNTELLELVAIGTVADIAPLQGINRTLVTLGLASLRKTKRVGLLALLKSAGVTPENIDAEDISFIIAPRINAAGRIDDARSAYELLLTEKPEKADELAAKLEGDNRSRKSMTDEAMREAKKRVAALEELPYVLVLRDKSWSPGILGLIASRLVDDYNRPVIVMQEGETTSRASARSVKGFHMRDALAEIAESEDAFVDFGGHEGAAGFTIHNEFLDEFESWIQDVAEQQLEGKTLQPEITADTELALKNVNLDTCALLERMEPFGEGNALPVFASKAVRVVESRTVGGDNQHLVLRVASADTPQGETIEAMFFKRGDLQSDMAQRPKLDLLYTLEKRCWQEKTSVRLVLKDVRPSKD